MPIRLVLGGLLLTLAAPLSAQPAAGSAEEAATWLLKMSEAARVANYQGSVFYSGDEVTESFKVTHRYSSGVERERVQSLSGEPREVEKLGDKTICLLPSSRRQTERPTPKGLFPGLTRERLQQMAQVYNYQMLGEGRVAGRVCRGIAITPRDSLRYGYQVWADAQTGVPLKMELHDGAGRVLERMEFVEIDYPREIPDTAFAVQPSAFQTAAVAPPATATPMPLPAELAARFGGRLPAGFHVTLRDVRAVPGKGVVEHWLLSDGLTAISVFTSSQRPAPSRGFTGSTRIGALNAYGRVSGSMHITVVGEVPPQTVQMVGDGLKLPAEPAAQP